MTSIEKLQFVKAAAAAGFGVGGGKPTGHAGQGGGHIPVSAFNRVPKLNFQPKPMKSITAMPPKGVMTPPQPAAKPMTPQMPQQAFKSASARLAFARLFI